MTDPRPQSPLESFGSDAPLERVASPVISELSSAVADVAIHNAGRLEFGDDQSEPSVFIATPYSERSIALVDAAQSERPPLDDAGVPITLTARINIEDLAEELMNEVFVDAVRALVDSVPEEERLSVTTAYTSFKSYTPGHTPPLSARPNIMDRFDLRDVIKDEARSAVSSWLHTVDVQELEMADSDPPSAPPSPLPSPARAKVQAARDGIAIAEADVRRWQDLIMGVALRLRTMPSIQVWPENQSFPLSLTQKLVTDADNVPLALACATALGQLESSWARVAKETKQMIADRHGVEATTSRLTKFVKDTQMAVEDATKLNSQLVKMFMQGKEDVKHIVEEGARMTMMYSDAAANITILNAKIYKMKMDLNAIRQKTESVGRLAEASQRAEDLKQAEHQSLLEAMELKSEDAIEDLRAHRVAQAFVADLTERCHIEKIRREKKAATKIQASFRGKCGRRKHAAKKRMDAALHLLAERKRQLLDREMTLAPIRDELTRKENDLANKVAEWKRQLLMVREASSAEIAPFRDTLKLEQTRVLALHSEMDSLRSLKSLDASRDASQEMSLDAKKPQKQEDRLQFPPLRVPGGTGSVDKPTPSKKEMWASPVKVRSKMGDIGKRKLKDLADLYAPATVETLGTYGLPPDQARPQVMYRSLQPSGSSSRLQKSGEHSLSKSMSSLQKTLAPRKLRDVEGHPVRSEKWVLQTALA
jgi:hypothetical protein